jgi:WD40 repeat protein
MIMHQFSENRIYDLAVTPDGSRLVAICTAKMLHVYDLREKVETACLQLQSNLTSVHISRDSRYALINTAAQEIEMWDLQKFCVVRRFSGHQQDHFVIRSCFGGAKENFVLSGSEGMYRARVFSMTK